LQALFLLFLRFLFAINKVRNKLKHCLLLARLRGYIDDSRPEKKRNWEEVSPKNLSQNWLAEKLGISSGYMSQLMCGVRHPSPKMRQAFMDYFGCEFDDIFKIGDAE
jgi:DNA-binding XRE family transcriptional regulator